MGFYGMVSVWFGVSESFQNLEEYVDIGYTKDGDAIDSKFGANFEFGYYDEDNIEICFNEDPQNNIEDILSDFSYSEQFIPRIKELINGESLSHDINSVIVLYNFKYSEVKSEDKSKNIEMKFIGTVPYE
ncbi:immunity 22 family protein [Priestia endophytica]|uniref:immunity 22 family protein n=1 Tax=Priestia endophytica TaxID=135735 RepID=UPI002042468D|nr:immunity 22 family protein [Priestia endophytica]MCM3537777.1 immunity 22 family protein [Priestia endophytica]